MTRDWFSWIKDDSLRGAANYTLNGGVFGQDGAKEVIRKLWDESTAQIQITIGKGFYEKYYPTDRHGGRWSSGNPVGVVDHYTAGVSARGTLKWFSKMKRESGVGNSSAHAVIERNGVIYLVVDPLKSLAFHARSANRTSVGIEHVNVGYLRRKRTGEFYNTNQLAYPPERVSELQEVDSGLFWEPYTSAQLVANIVLKRWLVLALKIGQMRKDHFVDHQQIDPARKKDCGPLWPLHELNELVFSMKPVQNMRWLSKNVLSQKDIEEFKIDMAQV